MHLQAGLPTADPTNQTKKNNTTRRRRDAGSEQHGAGAGADSRPMADEVEQVCASVLNNAVILKRSERTVAPREGRLTVSLVYFCPDAYCAALCLCC